MKLQTEIVENRLAERGEKANWIAFELDMTTWYVRDIVAGKVSCSERTAKNIARLLEFDDWRVLIK